MDSYTFDPVVFVFLFFFQIEKKSLGEENTKGKSIVLLLTDQLKL